MTVDYLKTKEISQKIFGIIHDLPNDVIEKFLDVSFSEIVITKYNIGDLIGISAERANDLIGLFTDPALDKNVLKSMFVTGLDAKKKFASSQNLIEIVWTGPVEIDPGVRNTKPVIVKMLKSTQPHEKIILVDYMITAKAKDIIEELHLCLKRGVKVDMIIDNNTANQRELRKCFSEKSLTQPTIYTRKEKESKYYKIHAKVILIEDREMLVSSANLTHLGTLVNFELGLWVKGPSVNKMSVLIKKMIEDEYFIEDDHYV